MTVIFANKDTLLIDTVGTQNDFAVFCNKMNEYHLNRDNEFNHSRVVTWCCAGCPNTGDEIIHHYDRGTKMLGELRDTIVFFYDSVDRQTYRISVAVGEVPAAVPVQSGSLGVWGDGQVAFMQTAYLYGGELIELNKFGDGFAALWLGDTSRLNHAPSYVGWVDGTRFETGLLGPEVWDRLVFLATDS